MTFDEAIIEANESGWYLHSLHQGNPDELAIFPDRPYWTCTLRAASGPPRREISHGSGPDPILAIYNALGAAPELEAEVSVVDLRGLDDRASPPVDLMKMFVKREPINRRL